VALAKQGVAVFGRRNISLRHTVVAAPKGQGGRVVRRFTEPPQFNVTISPNISSIISATQSDIPTAATREKLLPENSIQNAEVLSSHEQLERAQEAVFVEGVLAMPVPEIKVSLGHDKEFKQKWDSVPKGKYHRFDALKESIALDPIIAAQFVRAHLMPRSPFADMVRDVFKAAGKDDYETTSDFLFEIHAVNVTTNVTTIQRFEAEAEVNGTWIRLPRLDDLSDYQLVYYESKEASEGPFADAQARIEELDSFWDKIKHVQFQRAVGYAGWARFELTTQHSGLAKPVLHKVRLIDALGGIHPVLTIDSPDERYTKLRHSPKTYER
jgi:hypothetical protein